MKYEVEIEEQLLKIFSKIAKKKPKQLLIISKKIEQIRETPYHFKPLKGDLKGSRRVHIDRSFVLVYDIDEDRKTIRVLDYDHHDKIY